VELVASYNNTMPIYLETFISYPPSPILPFVTEQGSRVWSPSIMKRLWRCYQQPTKTGFMHVGSKMEILQQASVLDGDSACYAEDSRQLPDQ